MDEIKLKERLFAEFGGFADKRIKNLKKSDYFTCDEGAPTDARGQLFLLVLHDRNKSDFR